MQLTFPLRAERHSIILSALFLLLLLSVWVSLTIGAVGIPLKDVVILLLQKVGLFRFTETDAVHEMVLMSIRLPRILTTIIIGGALGISGAALQGLFRNPLVEPGLIGVSGGAASAVVLMIVFGVGISMVSEVWVEQLLLSFIAFAGGMAATVVVIKLSLQQGRTNMAVMILVGVAMNAITGAIIGLAIFYADDNQLRTFTFWTLGDLGGATWDKFWLIALCVSVAIFFLLKQASTLNALALGEAEAFHLGVDTEQTKRTIILSCALLVGVSVAMAGMIGFVGLVVPHIIRVICGPDNRLVLPASVLGGACLLVLADSIARTIVMPAELPIGVITAMIGAPFFMYLLLRAKQKNEW